MDANNASLSNLPVEVFNTITLELDGRHIILLRLTGDINLNRRLSRGGVTRFDFDRTFSHPYCLCLTPFENLSELCLKNTLRGPDLSKTLTFSPGSINARLRRISWPFYNSFTLFSTLLASGEHDFSGIEELELSADSQQPAEHLGEKLSKLKKLRTLSIDSLNDFHPAHLPRTITKCFIECEKVFWSDRSPYSGLPPLLEDLKVHTFVLSKFTTPLPPNLTSLSITSGIFSQQMDIADMARLPPGLTSLNVPINEDNLSEILSALPPSLTHLIFDDAPTISVDDLKRLPRSLTHTNLTLRDTELDASNVVFFPPSLNTLCCERGVDAALAGLLPRSLTKLTVFGPLVGELPPTLKTLELSPLDDSFKQLPSLTSLVVDEIQDGTALWHLPSTLTELIMTSRNTVSSGFFRALPRNLRSFEFFADLAGNNQYVEHQDLQGLPPSLSNICFYSMRFKSAPDWSNLPKHLQFVAINATIDSDPNFTLSEAPTFKNHCHLERLSLHLTTDLRG